MDIEKQYPDYTPGTKWIKKTVVSIVFFVLGRALAATPKRDEEARRELEPLPEGFVVTFAVAPNGPYMSVKKENGGLTYLGLKPVDNPGIAFIFKHMEPAFKMLTAQMSFPQVYTENSLGTVGDPDRAMIFYRVSNIVQFYLWPKIIAKLVLKDVPRMTLAKFWNRIVIYVHIFV